MAGYGLSSGGFDVHGDKDLFRVGAAAPQQGAVADWRKLLRQPQAPQAPGPSPLQMMQQQAEAKPEGAVQAMEQAVGAPPVDTTPDAAFTGAGPGVLRPGLPTRKPAPDDGGLKALQRRVY